MPSPAILGDIQQPKVIINIEGFLYHLPMPTDLSLGTNYSWDGEGQAIVNATRIIKEKWDSGAFGDGIKSFDKYLSTTGPSDWISKAAQLMGTGTKKLASYTSQGSYASRMTPNPKQTMMFRGSTQRTFNMAFNLAAKNEADMATYINYLNSLAVDAAPDSDDNSFFFKWPKPAQLYIMDKGKQVLKPREVQITGYEVNLTPQGVWSTYAGGKPVNIHLGISFVETKIPTKQNDKNLFG